MSDRDYTNSPCYILMNTQESETESEIEAMCLAKYKNIEMLRISAWKTLDEINKQITEISTTTGTLDKAKLGNLQTYKRRISNKIESYNKNLRSLEEKTPLKDIIERHRTKERDRATREYRERIIKETQEKIAKWEKDINERQKQRIASVSDNHNEGHSYPIENKNPLRNVDNQKSVGYTANYQAQPAKKQHQKHVHAKWQNIKNFLSENILWFLLALAAIVALISAVSLPDDHWFRKLILAPFVLLGGLTIWSGCIAMAEQFDNHAKLHWHQILIFIISIFSIVVFFIWIG